MSAVFAVDACRTPIGKIKGALAGVRPDHLTAEVISALMARNPWLDPQTIDDVYWGAANQAGNKNGQGNLQHSHQFGSFSHAPRRYIKDRSRGWCGKRKLFTKVCSSGNAHYYRSCP